MCAGCKGFFGFGADAKVGMRFGEDNEPLFATT